MKIIAMAVAYERPIAMRILMDSFLMQTDPNWELTVLHDGWASDDVWNTVELYENEPRIKYRQSEERYQQFGHPNRKMFLKELEPDPTSYVLLTNDDNYNIPVMVEKILNMCDTETGMVYFDTVHSHFDYNVLKSQIRVDQIDIGSFVVRADIAKEVGFNNFAFNGDGYYAVQCANMCLKNNLEIKYIPRPLFIHN